MVEWLEQRIYYAESRWKVPSSNPAWPSNNSVNPAVNGYLFRIREGSGNERRGMAPDTVGLYT